MKTLSDKIDRLVSTVKQDKAAAVRAGQDGKLDDGSLQGIHDALVVIWHHLSSLRQQAWADADADKAQVLTDLMDDLADSL